MARIRLKRGTRAQLDAAAVANTLAAGEPYLITDEGRIAVGTGSGAYAAAAKQGGEGGGAHSEAVRSNLLLNPGFAVNQRGVSGTITRPAYGYAHDMWRAGTSGCTYSTSGSGHPITATVASGTIQQVVEGRKLGSGPVCLSWDGTAQARIDGGAWGASGIASSSTAGTQVVVEFGPGSFASPKLEQGATPTPFIASDISVETLQCGRYLHRIGTPSPSPDSVPGFIAVGGAAAPTSGFIYGALPTPMRAVPTFSFGGSSSAADFSVYRAGSYAVVTSLSLNIVTTSTFFMLTCASSGFVAGDVFFLSANAPANKFLLLSAEI